MTPTLVFQEGPLAGRRIELDGELIVGREDASLTIEDPEISRQHAAIRPVDGGFEIEDLGSRNGTHVNGSRIEGATRLGGGDSIKLGQSVIAFEAARGPETVASPVQAPPAAAAPEPAPPAPSRAAPRSAPREPFGTYAAPASSKRRGGIASRQLAPQLLTFAAVGATAVALVVYFAQH
jgi:hypothetical protein